MNIRHQDTKVHDILGIGFGPSNLALAIAIEELGSRLDIHFIEGAAAANWHPGMLLDGADIQNNPLRDLVTLRNPQSYYSFVNFLKCDGRLVDFLNLGMLYPLRKDYARYVQWAAKFFDRLVTYNTAARSVAYDADSRLWSVETNNGTWKARALVVGTGRSRNVPDLYAGKLGPRLFHLCDYRNRLADLGTDLRSIAVIGASQSAAEILHDLMVRDEKLEIHAVHRSFAMKQKDTSPFSDHVYFPEFIDYFFSVDDAARMDLQRQLRSTNYNSVDIEALNKLYLCLYEERLDGRDRFHMHNNTLVDAVEVGEAGVGLVLRERFIGTERRLDVDAVVLATGFKDLGTGEGKEAYPPLLAGIAGGLARRHDGALDVARDYSVASDTGLALYLNGLCESSHGLGDAGSFSLLSLRSVEILKSLEAFFSDTETDPVARTSMTAFGEAMVPLLNMGGGGAN